jgi:hypothetical protein
MVHERSARKIGSIAEAEAFAGKIQQLLIDHKLSMSDVKATDVKPETPISEHTVFADALGYGNLKKRWDYLCYLSSIVAEAHFCRTMVSKDGGTIWFVGKEGDRWLAEKIFRYLATLGIELGSKALRAYTGPDERWPYLKGFYMGYAGAIGTRYHEQQAKAEAASTQAIVLFKTSREALSRYVDQRCTARVVRRSRRSNQSYDGWAHGHAAGNSVALSDKVLEG